MSQPVNDDAIDFFEIDEDITRDLETTGAGKIWSLQAPTKTNKLILSSTSIEIERVRASHSMSEKETERLAGLLQGQRDRRRFS
jgi:hypothetical protein